MRHFLDIKDFDRERLSSLLDTARDLKSGHDVGQPLDGLQSELFAPWRSDACHDPTEWCWTGADGAEASTIGER